MRSSRDRQCGPFRQSLSTLLKIALASTTPRKRGASEQYGSSRTLATASVTSWYSMKVTVAGRSDTPDGFLFPGCGRGERHPQAWREGACRDLPAPMLQAEEAEPGGMGDGGAASTVSRVAALGWRV